MKFRIELLYAHLCALLNEISHFLPNIYILHDHMSAPLCYFHWNVGKISCTDSFKVEQLLTFQVTIWIQLQQSTYTTVSSWLNHPRTRPKTDWLQPDKSLSENWNILVVTWCPIGHLLYYHHYLNTANI